MKRIFSLYHSFRLHGSSPSPQPSRRYAGPVNTGIPPSNHGPGNPGIPLSNHGPGNPGIPLSNQFPPGTQFSAGNQFATLPQARLSSADRNKSSHRYITVHYRRDSTVHAF